jgi:hypothetical protein
MEGLSYEQYTRFEIPFMMTICSHQLFRRDKLGQAGST